jgi:hypothetical protein
LSTVVLGDSIQHISRGGKKCCHPFHIISNALPELRVPPHQQTTNNNSKIIAPRFAHGERKHLFSSQFRQQFYEVETAALFKKKKTATKAIDSM